MSAAKSSARYSSSGPGKKNYERAGNGAEWQREIGNGSMSRIGKKPVQIPSGVTVTIEGQTVKVKGPKGELQTALVEHVTVKHEGDEVIVNPVDQSKTARSAWGLSRTLVANMVTGVTDGFSKNLEINGVGYRAAVQGNGLQLNLGYSHDVVYPIPSDVKIEAPKPTEIVVSGIDKQRVGQVAAEIREWRRPEPYKGKGIKYADEYIFRKEGKKK
jgi:large subunit ribosomal protein L6